MHEEAMLEEMERVFALQGKALATIRATTAQERIAKLQKLKAVIQAHFGDAVSALHADLGKPAFEAVIDVGAAFTELDEAAAHLPTWMQPRSVQLGPHAPQGATAEIQYQPKGRVLVFGPWNFPFSLLFQPLIGAIAAGNAVVLKPSEMAPATAAVSARIVAEVFDESEVALFPGGADVAGALLDLPFDHIFFTGSTSVGRRVMTAAARHLSSVTLELGGKCPVVIDQGVDLQKAAGRIAWGKFLNAGQICLAPDHVWLRADQRDPFVDAIGDYLDKAYRSTESFNTQDFARIIDARNQARLTLLIEDAIARGARAVIGGGAQERSIEPTVLVDVPRDSAIMQEEIFGPILPILTYSDDDDVTAQLNGQPKPLAMYVFSDRESFGERTLGVTSSGGVTVNDVIQHAADFALPFGGVGASGMGSYHGRYSFLELSHARSVYRQAETNPAEGFLRPPYGSRLPT